MFRDAFLVASKDLRIEKSSRIIVSQILPFSLLILILFGMAISSDLLVKGSAERSVLEQVAPGLFWLAIVFSALFAVSRSFAIESVNGNLDALRMAGLDPAAIFLGKATSVALEIFLLQIFVGIAAFFIYGSSIANYALLAVTLFTGTISISTAGTLYAGVAAGAKTRDTLLPLLLLPTLAPVLLVATRSTESALFPETTVNWGWALILSVFALLYVGIGMLAFDSLMEES